MCSELLRFVCLADDKKAEKKADKAAPKADDKAADKKPG